MNAKIRIWMKAGSSPVRTTCSPGKTQAAEKEKPDWNKTMAMEVEHNLQSGGFRERIWGDPSQEDEDLWAGSPGIWRDCVESFLPGDRAAGEWGKILPEPGVAGAANPAGWASLSGMLGFAGGFVRPAGTTEEAAEREFREETSVDRVYLEQLYTFSRPGRDPRTWVMSCSCMVLVDSSRVARDTGVGFHW